MKQVIGIESLKDEWRIAKLKSGDLRGLKNRFALSKRLGINQMHTWFHAVGGNGKERIEVYAEVYIDGQDCGWQYSLKDLLVTIDNPEGPVVIQLCAARWNKERTDATRTTITPEFLYKNTYL